jgi:hypothetical protein
MHMNDQGVLDLIAAVTNKLDVLFSRSTYFCFLKGKNGETFTNF